jgi:hypothetical protein
MVATFDVRQFFPSTNTQLLTPVFTEMGFRYHAADALVKLVTLDDELPQGAPTSSLLANLAFSPGDDRFIRICRRRHLHYSRYVDDIAVSGDCDFCDLRGPFMQAIRLAGYDVAEEKIRFMRAGTRQIVTGLLVNERIRPTRQYLADLRRTIRLCMKNGAQSVADCNGVSVGTLKSQLTGRVAHVRHVDERLGARLRGLLCGVDWRSADRIQRPLNEAPAWLVKRRRGLSES